MGILVLLHRLPQRANRDQTSVAEEYDFTLREALRTRAFWFISVGQALVGLVMAATQVHLFLYLEQGVGLAPATAALIVSVTDMGNVSTRLLGGFLGDRLPKRPIVGGTAALMVIAVFILALATSLPMALAYGALYGIGMGARAPVFMAMESEYFGRKSQGIIRGLMNSVSGLLTVAAPVVVGYIADVQGSYRLVFIVVALAGAALLFLATPPKPPARKKATPR